jgi:hypothetical protein
MPVKTWCPDREKLLPLAKHREGSPDGHATHLCERTAGGVRTKIDAGESVVHPRR